VIVIVALHDLKKLPQPRCFFPYSKIVNMSTRKTRPAVTHHEVMDFHIWRGQPNVMGGSHTHSDIELNFVSHGAMEYFLAGKFQRIEANSWGAFWAGAPHELVRLEPQTRCIWVVLPLSWLAQWRLPESFTEALLGGAMLTSSCDETPSQFFMRWADEFITADAFGRETIALEVQAMLRRLAVAHRNVAPQKSSHKSSTHNVEAGAARHLEAMARYISQHYRDELSAQTIASAVNLHPKYAMQVFKSGCGMSLWEYVLRLRVSHAQRMLLAGDLTVERIAMESGFGSTSRFYEAFTKYTGHTPRAFRKMHS
jgi:AraC family transcriptional regulator, melibiose operon regulatory protein